VILISITSCGRKIEGKYYSAEKGFIDSIEFKDGKAIMIDGIFHNQFGAFPYEVKGNSVYISDPSKGAIPFEIVDSTTLKCDTMFIDGLYKKK
jgi:hypothetical protein